MSAIIELSSRLETTECVECGMSFAAPAHWLRNKRNAGGGFFCPAGHSLRFTASENDRLRKQVARLEEEKKRESERAARNWEAKEAADRRASAIKGALTKTKKRVGVGVCPCCNRTFKQLAAHMTTKHPDYRDAEVSP